MVFYDIRHISYEPPNTLRISFHKDFFLNLFFYRNGRIMLVLPGLQRLDIHYDLLNLFALSDD